MSELPPEFTIRQLLREIHEYPEDPGVEYHSREEWQNMWKVSRTRAKDAISRLVRAGRMEKATRMTETMDGRLYPVPVYRVVPK